MTATPIDLDKISEEELLNSKICDLPLSIDGMWLNECVQELYGELKSKGIVFNPLCYLAEEWLTPENEPVIGIPFYLAHPTLIKLEKKMMLEAEGETKAWCMKLLRHEAGHALCYAYHLNKKRSWQKVFGLSSKNYGDTYRFQPYSKRFVRHLDGFYAQYHPDEDFVETFAVWLTPDSNWQDKYKGWKALDKLKFVDDLMRDIQGQPPVVAQGTKYWYFKKLKITLKKFYRKRRKFAEEDFPDFYDSQLKKIFKPLTLQEYKEEKKNNKDLIFAADFLKKYHRSIVYNTQRSTGERTYIITDLLKRITERCRQMNMVVTQTQIEAAICVAVYVASLIMNYMHTGWFRGKRLKR